MTVTMVLDMSSISITWEPDRSSNSQALPRSTESETRGVGPSSVCFNEPSGWFGHILKFESHWPVTKFWEKLAQLSSEEWVRLRVLELGAKTYRSESRRNEVLPSCLKYGRYSAFILQIERWAGLPHSSTESQIPCCDTKQYHPRTCSALIECGFAAFIKSLEFPSPIFLSLTYHLVFLSVVCLFTVTVGNASDTCQCFPWFQCRFIKLFLLLLFFVLPGLWAGYYL